MGDSIATRELRFTGGMVALPLESFGFLACEAGRADTTLSYYLRLK